MTFLLMSSFVNQIVEIPISYEVINAIELLFSEKILALNIIN